METQFSCAYLCMKKVTVIVHVTTRSLGSCHILSMCSWRILCLQILLIILRLILILGSAVSASPRIDKSQSFSIP